MEIVRDTVLESGVLYYPIRPPLTSMLVVVKATFVLMDGEVAQLAETQDATTGELYHEDDPEKSVRYPSDFALLKPRGECFVVGSCRPHTPQPVDRTMASFLIGSVQKSLAVFGDRRWVRTAAGFVPSPPVPFRAMPLAWERAFGGPGFDENPLGRGIEPDAQGNVWLPNFEVPGRTLGARDERPSPAGAFPIGASWKSRRRFLGTYDERWQRTRFPWLAEDFRFAYFNEAPEDQQIDGHWRGDEQIFLTNLHPERSVVRSALPGLVPRVFVEHGEGSTRAGTFEEIRVALDTITVDSDRGLALCVWRGTLELAHAELKPIGLARLFVMHEAASARSSVEACRERMQRKLAGVAAEEEELRGEEPPSLDALQRTIQEGPSGELAAMIAAATAKQKEAKARAEMEEAAGLYAKVEAQMRAAGMDPAKLMADAEGRAMAEPMTPPDPKKVKEAFEAMGEEMPQEVADVLESLAQAVANPPAAPEDPVPEGEPDLRELVIETHRARRALRGDFTGANLALLDLRGLDANDAILAGANLRGANLERARLDGAVLKGADLVSADLRGASLQKADLSRAILEGARLDGADLDGAVLVKAELLEASLEGASLKKADLTGALLDGASLVRASCDEATFDRAEMNGAKCVEASFVEARFYGTRAKQMNLDRANVTRIRVGRGADLSGTSFRSVKGEGARFRDSKLEAVTFVGATLDQADFTDATLTAANLAGCPLAGAVFQGCKLVGAGLAHSNVFQGSFRQADLSGADLRGANLYAVDFFQARAEGVDLEGANVDGTMWGRP
jgi:uncharacterized protein YjbI with pentapeptide repeats